MEAVICPVHGIKYERDFECPMCMTEQDAAQDAKRTNDGSNR